jgi:hypothetical protein
MPFNPKDHIQRRVGQGTLLQNLTFVFCLLFGLTLVASIQSAADGVWFWYAALFNHGQRLYSGMHLALQPLFALETASFLRLLGNGWLVSKVPALCHVVVYCLAFFILVRQSKLADAQKALLLACAFFASISFEAYRFDDFHVLSDSLQLYSLIALLSLQRASTPRKGLVLALTLGVLSGLALTNRLNDGAALFVAVVLGILSLAPSRKLLSTALFVLASGLTALLVVHLTGDSVHDYALYSIFRAAGSKGGAGSVLTYPLLLPINTFRWIVTYTFNPVTFYSVVVVLLWTFAVRPATRKPGQWERVALAALGIGLIAFFLHRLYDICRNVMLDIVLLTNLSAFAVLLAYGLALWALVRFLLWVLRPGRPDTWDHRQILLLIPAGQLAASSMSSGGTHIGLYTPVAILLVLLAICSPIPLKRDWQRDCLFAFAVLLVLTTVSFRWRRPFSWHTYVEKPLFSGRTWYRHPVYGPMIVDRDLLQMIQPVCRDLKQGPAPELLSLPLPYANYFCNVPPWHGYVQTFFDTSSKQTIDGLMDELDRSPPQWIFYQRQLYTLRLHELIYNQGKPLEHRYLDELIERKVAQGAWHVVYTSDYGATPQWDNHWFLIQTH